MKKELCFDYRVVQSLQVEARLTLFSMMAKNSRLARFVDFLLTFFLYNSWLMSFQ